MECKDVFKMKFVETFLGTDKRQLLSETLSLHHKREREGDWEREGGGGEGEMKRKWKRGGDVDKFTRRKHFTTLCNLLQWFKESDMISSRAELREQAVWASN